MRPSVVRRAAAANVLAVAIFAAACGGDGAVTPPAAAQVGPESLTVVLGRLPDSVLANTPLAVRVMVRNPTSRPITAKLRCPAGGFVVQVLAADGTALRASPAACRAESVDGTARTLAPGDSVAETDSLTLDLPSGAYRIRGTYSATNGQARAAEARLVVRPGPGLCTRETVLTVGPGTRPAIRWSPDCVVTSVAVIASGASAFQWVIRVPDTTLRSPQQYGVTPPRGTVYGSAGSLVAGQRYLVLLGLRVSETDERTITSTSYTP